VIQVAELKHVNGEIVCDRDEKLILSLPQKVNRA
jgi:hypothetical protein